MFQVTRLPPASQLFLYVTLSPSIIICDFLTLNSLSSSVAVATSSVLFAKRRAVSFITANASGRISLSTSSNFSLRCLPSLSICWYISSFCIISVNASSSAFFLSSAISLSTVETCCLMRDLNSVVLLLSSSLESDA